MQNLQNQLSSKNSSNFLPHTLEVGLPFLPRVFRYRFSFQSVDGKWPIGFAGSAWRGALGHALKAASGSRFGQSCKSCESNNPCAYCSVFAPTAANVRSFQRSSNSIPKPFVVQPPVERPKSGASSYDLHLTMFDKAHAHISQLTMGLIHSAKFGIGANRICFKLLRITRENIVGSNHWHRVNTVADLKTPSCVKSCVIPPAPDVVNVHLQTPLRIRRNGSYILRPSQFHFDDLFSVVVRRLSLLTRHHSEAELVEDFRALKQLAANVEMNAVDLHTAEYSRFSSRQSRKIQMDGLTGAFAFSSEHMGQLWPYLWLGQWVNAGKGCTMGLGAFRVSAAQLRKTS